MTKRLYVVTIEVEFAVMAESEQEAVKFTDEAISDDSNLRECARARPLRFVKHPGGGEAIALTPDGWEDDTLVYGTKTDLTLKDAVAAERALHAAELVAEQKVPS